MVSRTLLLASRRQVRQRNCHEVVKIDHFLPGCPPRADAIWEMLVSLLENKPIERPYDLIKYD